MAARRARLITPCRSFFTERREALLSPMRIEPRPLPTTLPFLGDLPPLLTRLYAARGVQSEAELDKSLARLMPYQQLKGIDAAVDLLVTALEQRQRILIVGDFDADGATASTRGRAGPAFAGRGPRRLPGAQPFRVRLRPDPGNRRSGPGASAAAARSPWTTASPASKAWRQRRRRASRCWSPTTTCPATNCRRRMPSSIPTSRAARFRARRWPGLG